MRFISTLVGILRPVNRSRRTYNMSKARGKSKSSSAAEPQPALKRSRELQERFETGDLELAFSDGRTLRLDAAILKLASPVLRGALGTSKLHKGLEGTQRLNVRGDFKF